MSISPAFTPRGILHLKGRLAVSALLAIRKRRSDVFAQKQERRSDVFPQKHWMHFPGKLFQKGWLQLTVFVLPVRQKKGGNS